MTDQSWLHLVLEAPLLAFGGVRIDQIGETRDFPAASMLTGLFANALGYDRPDWQAHQRLQDRLVFAAARDASHRIQILLDMQNAKLEKNDKGWTTCGEPEGRDGASYRAPHRRQRFFHMDAAVHVVVRFEQPDDELNLDHLAFRLEQPCRPLFLGRKPCLPTGRILRGKVVGSTAYNALRQALRDMPCYRAMWPQGEGPDKGDGVDRVIDVADLRNWRSGLHGGTRSIVEGRVHNDGGLK